jgi:hypothetical protein
MFPFLLSGGKHSVQSASHPELVPLSEAECAPPSFGGRDPLHSLQDYSEQEIEQAKGKGIIPMDMREYCHNNGISWQSHVVKPKRGR